MATLKIKAKGHDYNGISLDKLSIKAKVKHTSDGLYRVDIKINGRFTEQQEAYILALLQKYEGQLPGIDVNVKIC